jgi:AcrR family transcriptional regulator
MDVLDETALDKLSMRLVAARLGVQVGGLYYYVADKAALLRRLADELCGQALNEFGGRAGEVAGWADEVLVLCDCVRAVLNRHATRPGCWRPAR